MIARFLAKKLRTALFHWRQRDPTTPQRWQQTLLLTSVGVTALMLGVRQLGWLQTLELGAYDQMMRLRPPEGPDARLLLVTITEADIQRQQKWPLSDSTFNQLLAKLNSYQPRVIGMDIYRDLPVPPGHTELAARLKRQDNIITICLLSSDKNPKGIFPPPTMPAERVGFSDLLLDPDRIVRRSLLFGSSSDGKCTGPYSFAARLASHYLAKEGIQEKATPQQDLQLGQTVFRPIDANAGGYYQIDAQGYQIMLNYRASGQIARQVTLTQVLTGQVDPSWVKNRAVLIGTTAESIQDDFYTPYSTLKREHPIERGVFIHAQQVSQILSAVLDGRSLIWYWPDWVEFVWVWGWSLVGGGLAWLLRHPLRLGLSSSAALCSLGGVCYCLFLQSGWVPLVPPALALVATSVSVVAYTAYQTYQKHQEIALQAREQEGTIALLTTLLNQSSDSEPSFVPGTSTSKLVGDAGTRLMPLLGGGRYKITKALGLGGFSHTYLAEDTQRPGNPICVVKQLMPARRDTTFLEVARRLFHTEAEILEALGMHNQIPQLLAYFENDQEFYLVEEYIKGHQLSEELPVDQRQSENSVINLLIGVLEVLTFIHDHHVLHRDIKPSNIIRRHQDGRLVLIDFGAVKQMQPPLSERIEEPTVAIGTRGYAPPEQFAGHPRLSSDIYALGMIAIQALTGIAPYQLQPNPETGTVLWRHLAQVSAELAAVIDKMVRYHFNERYQSAGEVLRDLKRLAE